MIKRAMLFILWIFYQNNKRKFEYGLDILSRELLLIIFLGMINNTKVILENVFLGDTEAFS